MSSRIALLLLLVLALVATACGGDGDSTAPTDDDVAQTATAEPASEPEPTEPTESEEPTEAATKDPVTPPPVAPAAPTAAPTATPTQPPAPAAGDGVEIEDAMGGDVPDDAAPYDTYVAITDDTGAITLEVPQEWSTDVDGRPFTDDQGREVFDVRAAPDLEAFATTWTTPGVIVTASRDIAQTENEVTLLDELVEPLSTQCTYLGRQPYADPLYNGQFDAFEDCGGTEAAYIVVGAVPQGRAFVIRVQVQVNDERDLDALERVLQTFTIVGDV